jgi:hypothetical protein
MKVYYRLYAKFEGQKRFKPLDLSTGQQVTNLIHATMIPEENLGKIEEIIEQNSNIHFQLEKIK